MVSSSSSHASPGGAATANTSSYYSSQQGPAVAAAPPTGHAPQAGYYQYRAPSQPSYTPFYPGQSGSGSTPSAVATASTTAAKISYPVYSQSSYAHQGSSYQQQSYKAPPTAAPTVVPPAMPPSSAGNQPSYAPAIQQYARQKVQGRGGATVNNSSSKKPFVPPSPSQLFYCETCKISCCSAAVSLPHGCCWWPLAGPSP